MRRSYSLGGWRLGAALLAAGVVSASEAHRAHAQDGPPSLTVMIVIDQFRQDVFEQYEPAFQHGFRRILDEGYRYTQASHAHARTSTAPGHATLATGVFPSRHAVVANSWQQRVGFQWEQMYAVADRDSPIAGFENEPLLEGRSPRNMLRESIADWFGAADRDSRRVSISKKDRAAIPMGGQNTEHVYWVVPELARFVTSTFYRDAYPRWLHRFNERVMPGIVEPRIWESEVPAEHRGLARGDTASYEGDGVNTWFPHVSEVENAPDESDMQHWVWGLDQPRADDAVIELAKVAIEELELGQRSEQDFLALSLSATDRVGHGYGPFSQEVLSTLIHVDALLGELFEHLDDVVGEGRWVVAVSGDHGVATMPEYAQEMGNLDAERILVNNSRTQLSEVLNEIARGGGGPDEIADRLARAVEERGIVEKAYTHFELTKSGAPADSFSVLYRNSYYPGRAWSDLSRFGVDLRFGEGDYVGYETGTSHESPYWYDRHVPIMLLGAGVFPGVSDAPVYTVDVAPTLAGLAAIPTPHDLDGRRIY
jgi:predicted AlkP superfamily pyrophosphatase or phosphodiesterase